MRMIIITKNEEWRMKNDNDNENDNVNDIK